MALLLSSTSLASSLFRHSSSQLSIPSTTISRLPIKPALPGVKCFNGVRLRTPSVAGNARRVAVKASAEVDGAEGEKPEAVPVAVENLPLESKLQERMEQKARMKLAKKIRLRRKRLVQKRKLRKKGRWPPSKMKKNKNV